MSAISLKYQGDLGIGRGQLGLAVFDTLSGNIILWTNYPSRPRRYFLDAGGSTRDITLPVIGIDLTEAQIGHIVTIKNIGTVGDLAIKDSSAAAVANIEPGQVYTIAAAGAINNWEIENASADTIVIPGGSGGTFQGVYDASPSNPSIELTAVKGAFNLRCPINNPAINSFNIRDNSDTNVFFRVSNNTATMFDPSISGLGANATAGAAFGNQITAAKAGSFTISDGGSALTADTENRMLINMANGFQLTAGPRLPGTVSTSPNLRLVQTSVNTTDGITPINLFRYTVPLNSIIHVRVTSLGVRTGGTGGSTGDSWSFTTTMKAKNISSTVTTNSPLVQSLEDVVGVIVDAGVSGGDALVTVIGLLNNNITWISTAEIYEYKFA